MRCTIFEPSNPLVLSKEVAAIDVFRTAELSKLDAPAQTSDAKIFSAHAHRFLRSHNDINQSVVGTEPKQDPAGKEQNCSIRLGANEYSFNDIDQVKTLYPTDIPTFEISQMFTQQPSPSARYGLNRSTSRRRNDNYFGFAVIKKKAQRRTLSGCACATTSKRSNSMSFVAYAVCAI